MTLGSKGQILSLAHMAPNNKYIPVIICLLCSYMFFEAGVCSCKVFAEDDKELKYISKNKRNPFVPIVDGRKGIRPKEELYGRPREVVIPIKLELKAILWEKENPLVVLNGKVFKTGDTVASEVKLVEIHRDHIIVNYRGKNSKIIVGGRYGK